MCTLHSSQAYELYSGQLKEALTQTYNKLKECLPGLPHMRFAEQSGNVLVISLIANKRNSANIANIPKTAETSRVKPNYPERQSELTGHSATCETGATGATKGKESLPLLTDTVYNTIPDMLKLPHTIKDSVSGVVYDLIQFIGSVRNKRKRFTLGFTYNSN